MAWIGHLRSTNTSIFVPDLWLAETVSVIRRMTYLKVITSEEGKQAIQDLFALGVQALPGDCELCLSAYQWAERLDQSKAYDGLYLALAERLSGELGGTVEFWTADEHLARKAAQLGLRFVRMFDT
jgi:predicted nucleic acid-binding protein